jgi:hypothetical protein
MLLVNALYVSIIIFTWRTKCFSLLGEINGNIRLNKMA